MNDLVNISKEDLLQAIRHDCVTFLSFYLPPEEMTLEVPEFHIEIWEEFLEILDQVNDPEFLVGQLKKLFCVPRGHAKSSLSQLAVVLFLRYSKLKFAMYASNTRNIALQACQTIKGYFDSQQDFQLYGPRPQADTANKSEGLWIFDIPLPDGTLKTVYLRAIGADTQVRGTLVRNIRPEMLVIDDCEDLNTCSTEETQKKLDEWMLGSLLKSVAQKSVVFMLGNMIRGTTLLARLSKEPEWNPTVFGAVVRDRLTGSLKSLWPGRYTLGSLINEYKAYRKLGRGHVWAHEMMNLTSESIFGLELDNAVFIPRPNPDQIVSGCIVLDPAFGEKGWNDDSAITCHVQLKDGLYGHGIPHVVETWRGKVNEDLLLDEMLRFSLYWGISTWCIESIAAQRLLIPLFRTKMILRMMNADAFMLIPITGGVQSKASRIKAFKDSVANGSYGMAESCEELLDKLIAYDPTSKQHDDLIDSASMGTIAWNEAGSIIESRGISQIAMSLYGVSEISHGLSETQYAPY